MFIFLSKNKVKYKYFNNSTVVSELGIWCNYSCSFGEHVFSAGIKFILSSGIRSVAVNICLSFEHCFFRVRMWSTEAKREPIGKIINGFKNRVRSFILVCTCILRTLTWYINWIYFGWFSIIENHDKFVVK